MCNYSKAKGLVTYHYRHDTSGSATVALSSTPRLSSFLFLLSSTSSLLSFCAIALFLLLLYAALSPAFFPSKRTPVN
jgi:hypothetical protein